MGRRAEPGTSQPTVATELEEEAIPDSCERIWVQCEAHQALHKEANESVVQLQRSYSSLLSEEAGLPVEILRQALTLTGREPSAKDQVLSAAQRISRLRAKNARKSEAPSTRVTDDVTVESDTPLLQRSYSALCADEAGVPIFFIKEALKAFGRDETAKAEVMSAAQRI